MLLDNTPRHERKQDSGFSLTELLVVMVMFGIITTAAYSLFREQGRISRAQQSILDMQSNGRAAINFLAQNFSHAGFGSSDTKPNFFKLENDFNGHTDKVTITYGHKLIGTVAENATSEDIIKYSGSINKGYDICLYPSMSPNVTYNVDDADTEKIDLDKSVGIVRSGAKIFRVYDVEYYVKDNILYLKDSDGESAIAFDVVTFQVAYLRKSSTTWIQDWIQDQGTISNPQAAYIYLLLRTKDKEPGFKQGETYTLPWDDPTNLSFSTEDGYHYQSFETRIWIRNAN